MVFFVCMTCQESLKGGKVSQHRCSGPFSCVDCSKDFSKSDVFTHTSCVSEAQKYQGGLYKPGKQKRDPQAEWMSSVILACDSARSHHALFSRLKAFSNVPRKKAKFINFAAASLGCRDSRVLDEMFSAIEAVALASKPPPAAAAAAPSPAPEAEAEAATGKRRRAASSDATEATDVVVTAAGVDAAEASAEGGATAFRWKTAVLEALRGAKEGRLKASKLRRLVCDDATADGTALEIAEAEFEKRLAKLVKKGAVAASEDGKYIALAPKD